MAAQGPIGAVLEKGESIAAEGTQLPPKQLRMTVPIARVRGLANVQPPRGYVLRPFAPGDQDSWAQLLQRVGFAADWDRTRVDRYLEDPERREGSRVVSFGKRVVSVCFASRENLGPSVGVLDYVATDPKHQGKGLARCVCTAVLKFFIGVGYPAVTLGTDDWRLPAIKLYLSLGFEPVMEREDMPGSWERIMKEIGSSQNSRADR